jgi:hypothetical protein
MKQTEERSRIHKKGRNKRNKRKNLFLEFFRLFRLFRPFLWIRDLSSVCFIFSRFRICQDQRRMTLMSSSVPVSRTSSLLLD